MPLGIQRLNTRHQPPTDRIIFIKPLPGPGSQIAEEFLSRVAAICHPLMKAHHLSVMTLEEYEPNAEFIGRNFNAGEVIQLVLRSKQGGWLGFRSVVMVMVHELAHCVQMNHSREFWKVRNLYAEGMRALWEKGYTGEGVWGPGRDVGTGGFERRVVHEEEMPGNLCGGIYRSRGRGRKRKRGAQEGKREKMSYAEHQQRRIARKFGVNGQALGEDEVTRTYLERGKSRPGKPRVANSKRGRELRAEAALARFGQPVVKEEQKTLLFKTEEMGIKEEDTGSETESDYEDPVDEGSAPKDINGEDIRDSKGRGLVKVCADEDSDDVHVKEELRELQSLDDIPQDRGYQRPKTATETQSTPQKIPGPRKENQRESRANEDTSKEAAKDEVPDIPSPPATTSTRECPVCSLSNAVEALTCIACSHVLRADMVPEHWRCDSTACVQSEYLNSGDSGVCGVCGQRRPTKDG